MMDVVMRDLGHGGNTNIFELMCGKIVRGDGKNNIPVVEYNVHRCYTVVVYFWVGAVCRKQKMNCWERWKRREREREKGGVDPGWLLFPRRLCSSTCSAQCRHDNGRAHLSRILIVPFLFSLWSLIVSFTLFSISVSSPFSSSFSVSVCLSR